MALFYSAYTLDTKELKGTLSFDLFTRKHSSQKTQFEIINNVVRFKDTCGKNFRLLHTHS